ncbi:hypothetical protein EVAR_88719_1 [Eumeta japonica]|uniref:Uncharacterized protein n=1 Tax=Eumeta variegata TaxID=151549 RepID=A0A4C1XD77_EUMVA|nr:hypothetical protein EVAR_88719_1 [Eumeta japonica]
MTVLLPPSRRNGVPSGSGRHRGRAAFAHGARGHKLSFGAGAEIIVSCTERLSDLRRSHVFRRSYRRVDGDDLDIEQTRTLSPRRLGADSLIRLKSKTHLTINVRGWDGTRYFRFGVPIAGQHVSAKDRLKGRSKDFFCFQRSSRSAGRRRAVRGGRAAAG